MLRPLLKQERRRARSIIEQSATLPEIAGNETAAGRLEEVVSREGRAIEYEKGDIVVQEGDYARMAFFLLDGVLREVIRDEKGLVSVADEADILPARSWKSLFRWGKADEDDYIIDAYVRRNLSNMEDVLRRCETARLHPDAPGMDVIIGDFAVLTHSTHRRTVFAETSVHLLSMSRRGMRELMRLSSVFRESIHKRCHAYVMGTILPGYAFHSRLSTAAARAISETSVFDLLGTGSTEATIVRQGDSLESLFLVQSGFGRVSRVVAGEDKSIGFVRKGDFFGLAPLAAACSAGRKAAFTTTLRTAGEMSTLILPAYTAEAHLLPALSRDEIIEFDRPNSLMRPRAAPSGQWPLERREGSAARGFSGRSCFHQRQAGNDRRSGALRRMR